jgi:hypothetical protein
MAIFSYNARVDEVALSRDQTTVRARTYLPALTSEREAVLGRIFGFIELNMPRTPQVDKILAGVDRELNAVYGQGALRPGENQEEYFENALRRVERRIFTIASENRIRLEKENIHLIFGVVVGANVHLAAHGDVLAYFIRRAEGKPTKVVDILSGMDDESLPEDRLLCAVVSGKMNAGDVILIANQTMAKTVPIADFVQSTALADPAALGSHLRSMALLNRPIGPAIGLIVRLAVSRSSDEAKKENPSVKAMLTREEEVARVLEPSGIPKLQKVFGKVIGAKEKNAGSLSPRPAKKKFSLNLFLDKVNQLPRRAKISLLVIITLLGVFFLSAEVISMNKRANGQIAVYTASVKDIQNIIDEAESSIIYDEARTAALIASARGKLDALPDLTKQEKTDRASLAAQLTDLARRLQHVYDVKPTPVADLPTGGLPSAIIASAGTFYASRGNDLFAVTGNNVKNIATFPAAAVWATTSGDKFYFMLANGTLLAVLPKNPLPTVISYSGPLSPRAGGFWNGRLYVVGADGLGIFKLNPTEKGFEGAAPWLKTAPTGKGIATIAVDGTIFAAVPGDAVYDYVKGSRSSFVASGATANADPKALFIGNNLYLLGGDGTIAEWDNKGKLIAQYIVPVENGKPTAFTADEANKNIYIATDKGKVMVFSVAK